METQDEKKDEKKKEKVIPAESIEILVGPNQYTLKRPNVGQIIDMERMKLKLSGGQHGQMLFGAAQAQQAFMYTEMVATFTVMLPELQKSLMVDSLLQLNQDQASKLVDQYEKKVYPWLAQLREAASSEE